MRRFVLTKAGDGVPNTNKMTTKNQLIAQGWVFTTIGQGVICATHLGLEKSFKAMKINTLRRKISKL